MAEISEAQIGFSEELRPAVEDLYNRHIEITKPWSLYEQIDWGSGESYRERPWSPEDYPLPDGVRSAVYVNLLTEDNAPYYTSLLLSKTPMDHPLQEWNGQWTMEEGQHAAAIRDWAHITRAIDPAELEVARRVQMSKGIVPQPETLADMLAYVPFQELATQVAHRNTALHIPNDKMGKRILGLIAGDEGRHYNFYRDLARAGFEIDPSRMMCAVARQVISFAMPGTGIPNFANHSRRIEREGIYTLDHFRNTVVIPTLESWDLENIEGLDPEAEKARADLLNHLERLGRVISRLAEKRQHTDD